MAYASEKTIKKLNDGKLEFADLRKVISPFMLRRQKTDKNIKAKMESQKGMQQCD